VAAHRHFADNARACIAEVESGAVKLGARDTQAEYDANVAQYFVDCRERAAMHDAHANGTASEEYRYSFAFLQKAHYIQTGECVALLP
jgi:AICAR transformylase/IMP cyclohydrolase PurH